MRPGPTGLVLTHNGKLLIAAVQDNVTLVDTERLSVAGTIGGGSGRVYVNVTADDKLLFVSEEGGHSISVIDIAEARTGGYKEIGRIPVGIAPIALTFSPDGKWLYTTSQGALPDWNWPKACKTEGRGGSTELTRPEGAVIVINVARASTDPAHAVEARIPAACSPVRMAISPAGDRIYVTARNSDAVLAFDTAKLISDPEHARVGMVPVGTAPVPIAVVDGGKKVVAGNSDRFGGSDAPQTLTVIDATRMSEGAAAVLGSVRVGAFPREMRVSAHGRTLFLTNFGSSTLQILDIEKLPPKK
jgi:DNA-binding beta-propeller fold protein YncE